MVMGTGMGTGMAMVTVMGMADGDRNVAVMGRMMLKKVNGGEEQYL